MAYDPDFYRLYAEYLVEPRVRRVHDRVLRALSAYSPFQRVVDLGCGQGNEFLHHFKPAFYVGIDVNAEPADKTNTVITKDYRAAAGTLAPAGIGHKIVAADYRDPDRIKELTEAHGLTAAVSLFSVECTAPCPVNQAYYENLFRATGIEAILAGGFYYQHAYGQEKVTEAGGLESYQTLPYVNNTPGRAFHETRVAIPCPSKLFGEDVVEVWRLLQNTNRPQAVEAVAAFSKISPNRVSRAAARLEHSSVPS